MSSVTIHDKDFVIYLEEEKIQNAIEKMAGELTQKYEGKDVVFVGVLNGCLKGFLKGKWENGKGGKWEQ